MKRSLLDYTLKIRLPVTLFVIASTFAITYYVSRSERDGVGYSPDQPIKFSHRLHAGQMNIDCKYCHTGVEKSRHAGIPPVSTCMNCHTIARKDKPEIIKLTKYYNENKPVPWKRVHFVPQFAYFNHSAHVVRGIDCVNCHGKPQWMEKIAQVHAFTMGDCLLCHREPEKQMPSMAGKVKNGPTNCNSCHR